MKKLFLSFILILPLSFFCGCTQESANISVKGAYICSKLSFLPQGEIVQTLGISVDCENIKKLASGQEEAMFIANLIDETDTLRQRYLLNYALAYIKNPVEEMKIGQGVKISQSAYRQDDEVVAFDVMFSSVAAWKYYHGITTQKQGDEEKTLLFSKQASTSLFPFASQSSDGEMIGEKFASLYLNAAKGLSFEKQLRETYNPTFVYTYATPSAALKSDANFSFRDDTGQYNHVWVAQRQELNQECKTTIYYNQVNKGMWILLTLTLSLGGLMIYLLTIKIKAKKQLIKRKIK